MKKKCAQKVYTSTYLGKINQVAEKTLRGQATAMLNLGT